MRQTDHNLSDQQGDQAEWRALIDRLSHGEEPPPPLPDDATTFDNPMVRKRVGVVITRAVLGDPLYQLYQLYCGDPWPL